MDPLLIAAWLLLAIATSASAGLLILQLGLQRVFAVAPQLQRIRQQPVPDTTLTLVIPAYNEASNISACLESVLSSELPCANWTVLVVDDDSTDDTTVPGKADGGVP